MKKKKISLGKLKVESFVTSADSDMKRTIKGGSTPVCNGQGSTPACSWAPEGGPSIDHSADGSCKCTLTALPTTVEANDTTLTLLTPSGACGIEGNISLLC